MHHKENQARQKEMDVGNAAHVTEIGAAPWGCGYQRGRFFSLLLDLMNSSTFGRFRLVSPREPIHILARAVTFY